MVKFAVASFALVTAGAALALVAGFLGRLHPAGDSFAVFRFPLALILLCGALALYVIGLRTAPLLGVFLSAVAIATLLPHWTGGRGGADASPDRGIVLYQKNIWVLNQALDELAADILNSGADIVTLQEIDERTRPILAALSEAYPTQVICPYEIGRSNAVLSRFPEDAGRRDCVPGTGLVTTVLETRAGPLRAGSLHLHWPWPFGQADQVGALVSRLEAQDLPTVMGGDFNGVRWSWAVHRISRASGTEAVGAARLTFRRNRLLLNVGIDHVLATGGQGSNALRPLAGSDHAGLLVRIVLPRAGPS